MKKILTLLIALFFQLNVFSQIQDHWVDVCENITLDYSFSETTDSLKYNLTVDITNVGTDSIFTYCDDYNTPTDGVTLVGSSGCYPYLAPNEVKTIDIVVILDTITVDCFLLNFKVKNGDNPDEYCLEPKQFCTISPLGIEDINRSDMNYTSVYYDMLGRIQEKPLYKGFYIERKMYEDGHQAVSKIYISR